MILVIRSDKSLKILKVSAKDSFQERERLKNKTIPIRRIGIIKNRGFIFITDLTKSKKVFIIFMPLRFLN